MRLAGLCSCVFAATVFGHDPVLAETVGTAISIKTKVAAEQTGAQRVLTVGAGVAQDEMIQTDDSGNAQLKFVDETLLVIGPSSSIKLDKILFAPNRKAKTFVLEAVAGAFRFASGKSSHSAYEIHTPIATIGVRGTQFAFGIQGDEVTVVVTQGSVSSCIRATARCVTAAAGNTIVSTPSGAVVRRTLGGVRNVLRTVLTLPTTSPVDRKRHTSHIPTARICAMRCRRYGRSTGRRRASTERFLQSILAQAPLRSLTRPADCQPWAEGCRARAGRQARAHCRAPAERRRAYPD